MQLLSPADLGRLDGSCRYFRRATETAVHELAGRQTKINALPIRRAESWAYMLHVAESWCKARSIRQVQAGGRHSVVLRENGQLLTFGRSAGGRQTHEPQQMPLGRSIAISCGNDHTLVVTRGGQLFSFGEGECGQLGSATWWSWPSFAWPHEPGLCLSTLLKAIENAWNV